ncbi:hypothetical protein [Bradyrhizobium centrolobii]|uniref:hypothetical protein n=1 Tax=Bradyrhizobium centrolobii TaxID=1505087 RepID=UPI000AA44872|nr:hypothetical protein [Bradyrhizobium centrolobii]
MPQIWLSHEELAALLACDIPQACAVASAIHLDRRKSRDGTTRAKLTPSPAVAFLDGLLQQRFEQEIAACAGDLRTMHERMARRGPARRLPAAIAG